MKRFFLIALAFAATQGAAQQDFSKVEIKAEKGKGFLNPQRLTEMLYQSAAKK